jgi:hypothetical protein
MIIAITTGAVVLPNTIVPPDTMFGGVPAKKIKDIHYKTI